MFPGVQEPGIEKCQVVVGFSEPRVLGPERVRLISASVSSYIRWRYYIFLTSAVLEGLIEVRHGKR